MKLIKQLFICFLLLSSFSVKAQVGIPPITGFSPNEYKGSSDVGSLFQNKRGFIYMGGSGNMLFEYDGISWNQLKIPCNIPNDIIEDKNGNLIIADFLSPIMCRLTPDKITGSWIAETLHVELPDSVLEMGLTYNLKKIGREIFCIINSFKDFKNIPLVYKYNGHGFFPLNIKSSASVVFSCLTNKGAVVLTSEGTYLYNFETLNKKTLRIDKNLLYNRVKIYDYSETEILILTFENGIWKYNLETDRQTYLGTEETRQILSNHRLLNAKKIHNGSWVVGTVASGIFVLNNEGNIIKNISMEDGLKSNLILNTFQDNQNQLWLGLYSGGTNRIDIQAPIDIWTKDQGVLGATVLAVTKFQEDYIANTITHTIVFDKNTNTWKPINQDIGENFMLKKLRLADGKEHLFGGERSGLYEISKSKNNSWKITNLITDRSLSLIYGSTNHPNNPNKIYFWTDVDIAYFNYNKIHEGIHAIPSLKNMKLDLSMTKKVGNSIWTRDSEHHCLVRIELPSEKVSTFPFDTVFVSFFDHSVQLINKSGDSIFTFNDEEKFIYNKKLSKHITPYTSLFPVIEETGDDYLWINTEAIYSSHILKKTKFGYERYLLPERLINKYQINSLYSETNKKNIVWVSTSEGILKLDLSEKAPQKNKQNHDFQTYIRQIKLANDSIIFYGNFTETKLAKNSDTLPQTIILPHQPTGDILELPYSNNTISFSVAAPYFVEEKQIQFLYFLEGFDKKWTKPTKLNIYSYTNLPAGEYTFKAKAINHLGNKSEIAYFNFQILKPWYQTIVAYILYALIVIGIAFFISRIYTRQLRRKNERLERLVKKRTQQVTIVNAELQKQNEEIMQQKDLLEERNKKIDKQNSEILSSIDYAQYIQSAMLPSNKLIQKHIPNHFIFYQPRDIVSGDFYWIERVKNKIIIAIVDCTGHGVPGAFMSMLGNNGLSDAVFQHNITEPHLILSHLHTYIVKSLRQKESDNDDGMDIAIIIWDKDKHQIKYSGAKIPLYVVQNKTITKIKADIPPIGGTFFGKERKYKLHTITIDSPIHFYITSDGFRDQFGGPKYEKFMNKRFEKLLLKTSDLPINNQKKHIEQAFNDWKKESFQFDDILVFGMQA